MQPQSLITPELARYTAGISKNINRQVGLLIARTGAITHVIIGDTKGLMLPSLDDYPIGRKALRGLRLIHTHLKGEPLSKDDLTDLALLRLDAIAAIGVDDEQLSHVETAYLVPDGIRQDSVDLHHHAEDFLEDMEALEEEMRRKRSFDQADPRERAILVSFSTLSRHDAENSMDELRELALSSDVIVLDTVLQRLKKINPKYLGGEGKLKDIVIEALNKGATILIFDQDLSPSQSRSIAELTEIKVIDRSQLILDVFSRRAHSRDGRVQVELAQLKYRLPRLSGHGTSMSRLMGGIGGRGPGEMKLEIDRRRVRDRITLLEKELETLSQARRQRKSLRVDRGVPIASIVGYTNAGKSTLLNLLTKSDTFVENKMFATLDTASRRLRMPHEREIVITDTVGFIRDLPKDLMAAFAATLEELGDSDLLVHLVDASSPRIESQIASVEAILKDLELSAIPRMLVLNKTDLISAEEAEALALRYRAVCISARDASTMPALLLAMEDMLWRPEANAG